MATYNERIFASEVKTVTNDGTTTPQTEDFSIYTRMQGTPDPGIASVYAFAVFDFPISGSEYASSKRIRQQKEYATIKNTNATSASYPNGGVSAIAFSDEPYAFGYSMTEKSFAEKAVELWHPYSYPGVALAVIVGSTTNFYQMSYDVLGTANIYGINSVKKPYIDIEWEDIAATIGGLAPTSGAFVDRTKNNRFSFTISVQNAFDGTPINHTKKLQWRIAGSEELNEIALSSNTEAIIPAGTFPAGSEIEWRIIDVTEYDITATSPWNTISTNDIEPEAPTNLRPKDTIVDGNTENLFSWTHNSPVGTEATKAELQQSNEGVSWNTFATVNGADNFYVVPANTFTAGVRYWRVRTYDTESEAGAWSEPAQILVKALPLPPAISEIVSKPRASISWQAADQIGWRVIFIDNAGNVFDSGERYGTEKTYRIDGFMSEGPGRVAVRVANELGLWSETEVELNIINQPPGEIALSSFTDRNGTTLTWNTDADTAYYIERDGKPIGKGNGSYLDKAGNGASAYRIRGVKDGYFALSNEVEIAYYPEAVEIFDVAINGNIIALYKVRGSIFQEGRSVKGNATYYHFAGAEQPTAYTGNYKSENISFRVTVENEKAHMLDALIDRVCCIKDKTGSKVYGVLDSIGYTVDRFTDLTLSFTVVEYDEEVNYD